MEDQTTSKKRKATAVDSGNPDVVDTFATNYICSQCDLSLPASSFSKTKRNQYERKKLTSLTCSSCTVQMVQNDEREMKQAKEQRLQQKVPATQQTSSLVVGNSKDPSLLYIANPLQAPIVHDARTYFQSLGVSFQVHLGPIQGWRTVAKLAVRCVFKQRVENQGNQDKDKKWTTTRTAVTSVGLFQPGSHVVLPGSSCSPAHHPSINQAAKVVEDTLQQLDIHGYVEGTGCDDRDAAEHRCFLKYLLLAVERKTKKVQLTLVWNTHHEDNAEGDMSVVSPWWTIRERTLYPLPPLSSPISILTYSCYLPNDIWYNLMTHKIWLSLPISLSTYRLTRWPLSRSSRTSLVPSLDNDWLGGPSASSRGWIILLAAVVPLHLGEFPSSFQAW